MADVDALIFRSLIDPERLRSGDQNTWRYKVLLAVADAGNTGATDNELAELLQAPGGQNNIRPRRGELVEAGYLVDSGQKRPTRSGSQATVWRLSDADRPTFTPAFNEQDCQLAALLNDATSKGITLPVMDREAGDRLRARFALLGRRARRTAISLGIPVEVTVSQIGPVELTITRSEGDGALLRCTAGMDGDGYHQAVRVGGGETGDPAVDSRRQRLRTELANLTDDALAPFETLRAQGYRFSTRSSDGDMIFNSTKEWLEALTTDASAGGSIDFRLDPPTLTLEGAAVVDHLSQLLTQVLPVDTAVEAAMRDPVQALVTGLLWDEERARNLLALTRRARQLLFAGPPGTGKTLAARILASALADDTRIKLVQFHPTYAYEDFVEGIRPVLEDEAQSDPTVQKSGSVTLRYRLRPGVFKQLVQDALKAPAEAAHMLIIDEINRANLPRVLGELLFALEYRGPGNEVELPYSAETFHVPDNLWIIGTMNTADRSVALLDAAMRRRFKEVRFDVDYTVVRRWHEKHTSSELGTEAAARLKRLNAEVIELLDDDRAIGHSFVIRHDLAEVGFEVVWKEDLEPVLRDHLLGRTDDLPALREAFLGDL